MWSRDHEVIHVVSRGLNWRLEKWWCFAGHSSFAPKSTRTASNMHFARLSPRSSTRFFSGPARHAGFRVGMFTSPHLLEPLDAIQMAEEGEERRVRNTWNHAPLCGAIMLDPPRWQDVG